MRENGNRGTNHGHANAMLLIGNCVRGGGHGKWPGLRSDQLYEGRDLDLTTDFRDVFAQVAQKHLERRNCVLFSGIFGQVKGELFQRGFWVEAGNASLVKHLLGYR